MARVKRGVPARHAKHKKVLEARQGLSRPRQEQLPHRDREGRKGAAVRLSRPAQPKRDFRALWIQRINAGVRAEGLTYSPSSCTA